MPQENKPIPIEIKEPSDPFLARWREVIEWLKAKDYFLSPQWLDTISLNSLTKIKQYIEDNPKVIYLVKVFTKDNSPRVESLIVVCHQTLINVIGQSSEEILTDKTMWWLIILFANFIVWGEEVALHQIFLQTQRERQDELDASEMDKELKDITLPIQFEEGTKSEYKGKYIITISNKPIKLEEGVIRAIAVYGLEEPTKDEENFWKLAEDHKQLLREASKDLQIAENAGNIRLVNESRNPADLKSSPQSRPELDNQEREERLNFEGLETAKRLVYNTLTSQELFSLAQNKEQEELKQEREKNRKLIEAILAKKDKKAACLSISAKKLPDNLKEDFRPYIESLIGLDEPVIEKIMRKGNFSILVELTNCGRERCTQGCNNMPPLAVHPKILLRVYNEKDQYINLSENFPVMKYLDKVKL
jgi:hypothetical protein